MRLRLLLCIRTICRRIRNKRRRIRRRSSAQILSISAFNVQLHRFASRSCNSNYTPSSAPATHAVSSIFRARNNINNAANSSGSSTRIHARISTSILASTRISIFIFIFFIIVCFKYVEAFSRYSGHNAPSETLQSSRALSLEWARLCEPPLGLLIKSSCATADTCLNKIMR